MLYWKHSKKHNHQQRKAIHTMTTTTKNTDKDQRNYCQCFTRFDEKQNAYVSCGEHTAREFAPGHDARLKGLLIRLYVAGKDYTRIVGGQAITVDPLTFAKSRGWDHFLLEAGVRHATKVTAANERAAKRDARISAQAAAKAAKAADKKPSTKALDELLTLPKARASAKAGFHPVRVKIGRWEYDANVVSEDVNSLTVSYLDKKGNTVTTEIKRSQVVS